MAVESSTPVHFLLVAADPRNHSIIDVKHKATGEVWYRKLRHIVPNLYALSLIEPGKAKWIMGFFFAERVPLNFFFLVLLNNLQKHIRCLQKYNPNLQQARKKLSRCMILMHLFVSVKTVDLDSSGLLTGKTRN